ncbi:hypothetical protein BKA62DRAFT_746739 [Auriculariales sp. MPI-PUGE-AT-0066]|nr:hypothetical protein BKA62DRAFT_746739 [Auriculariales sp. MPI-PUGE-AT-0066]
MSSAIPEPPAGANFDVDDPRVSFSRETNRWELEDDDGNTMEWDATKNAWIPVIDEDLLEKHQAAYAVDGVDATVPVEVRSKKRKKDIQQDPDAPVNIKRVKNDSRPPKPHVSKNTAVYVTGLPDDATADEIIERFSKFGVIMEDDNGQPKVKLYARADGSFNGEALVVYFKEDSVSLAVRMLDEAELRFGEAKTTMRVQKADFQHKTQSAEVAGGKATVRVVDKKKATKRIGKMQRKIDEWGSDDDFGPAREPSSSSRTPAATSRVVVLKHMFSLAELEEDASLLLDLKEDVREECSNLGDVTNVVLYDKESDGIMTIKFRDPVSAQACVLKMNGRFFGGRSIQAWLYDGKQRYRRSGDRNIGEDEDGDDDEGTRLDAFRDWLMTGE